MMKYAIILTCIVSQLQASITIRPIVVEDIPSALELDARICSEYFKPMFIEHYSHNIMGQNPDYCLGIDVANDTVLFPDCARNISNEKMWTAYDDVSTKVVGLIVAHQEDVHIAEIDLILVDQEYAGQGIGTKLMHKVFQAFNTVKHYGVYVFSHNYKALDFYKKLGFTLVGPAAETRATPYGISAASVNVYLQKNIE